VGSFHTFPVAGVLVTQDTQNHLYGITRRRTTCGILCA